MAWFRNFVRRGVLLRKFGEVSWGCCGRIFSRTNRLILPVFQQYVAHSRSILDRDEHRTHWHVDQVSFCYFLLYYT